MDEFPGAPLAEISDVYSAAFNDVISMILNISVAFNLILLGLYAFIVGTKSSKAMSGYRKLLLCYILAAVVFEVSVLCLKPAVLFPLFVVYPIGILHPMKSSTATVLLFAIGGSMATMADLLLAMLAQRYFILMRFNLTKPWIQRAFFAVQTVTNVVLVSLALIMIFLSFLPADQAFELVSDHIHGSQVILESQPDLLVSDYHHPFFRLLGFFIAFAFGMTRIVAFIFLLHQNFVVPKKTGFQLSAATQKQHMMLIKTICAQLFGMFIFVVLPIFIIYTLLQFPKIKAASKVWLVLVCFMHNFIAYDAIVTTICVKPYRFAVFSILQRHFGIRIAQNNEQFTFKVSSTNRSKNAT